MFAEALERKLAGLVDLSVAQVELLRAHYELLLHWNRVLNLTTVAGLEEAVERHYCESLFLGSHLPPGELRIVDIGSGPGFPGFPVAVLRPDCSITLVESHQRKAVFLKEACRRLPNVRVFGKRAEDLGEAFDHAISRAVSYRDLSGALKNLAETADILSGSEAPPEDVGFDWELGVPLPWGEHRFLRIGRRRKS